ncbi:transketolase, partial [Salmonella enterica]
FDAWAAAHPERKQLWDRLQARELPEHIADALPAFEAGNDVSTRAASGTVINALAAELPELWGGSADLAESNLTTIKDAKS